MNSKQSILTLEAIASGFMKICNHYFFLLRNTFSDLLLASTRGINVKLFYSYYYDCKVAFTVWSQASRLSFLVVLMKCYFLGCKQIWGGHDWILWCLIGWWICQFSEISGYGSSWKNSPVNGFPNLFQMKRQYRQFIYFIFLKQF